MEAYRILKQIIFTSLIFITICGLSSCGNLRSPCQWPRKWFRGESHEKCINNSYIGYKPIVKQGIIGWKVCSVKRDYKKLKRELFINVDPFTYEPHKGRPNNFEVDKIGDYQWSPGDNGLQGANLPSLLSVGEIKDGEKHIYTNVVQAFNACPYYTHIKDEAKQLDCPSTYGCLREETEKKLDNCLHRENGGKADGEFAEIKCPKDVSSSNNVTQLFDPTNQRNQQLAAGINVLYSHYNATEIGANYVVDPSKDVKKGPDSKYVPLPRTAYLKVIIGPSGIGNKDHKHKLLFYNKSLTPNDGNQIYLDSENQDGLRYCSLDDAGNKTYVVSVPLVAANNHLVLIQDISDGSKEVIKAELTVIPNDKFNNITSVLNSNNRVLNINTIKIPTTKNLAFDKIDGSQVNEKLINLAECKLSGTRRNSLEKALEDAFALNPKTKSSISLATVNPAIDISVKACDLSDDLKENFLDDGDILLLVDRIWEAWLELNRPLDFKQAYYRALSKVCKELYLKHSSNCGSTSSYEEVEKQMAAILVGGIDLGYKHFSKASTYDGGIPDPNLSYENTGIDFSKVASPNYYFLDNGATNGVTLPSTASDGPDLNPLEYHTTVFLFAKYIYNSASNSGTNLSSNATMTLAHELGHVWSQSYMMGTTGNAGDQHGYYCAGYNYADCAFSYRSDNKLSITKFDNNGIVFCEAHRHLMFNQLMRKYFK